jgi:hemerythrin-like domain-containing protein
MCDYCGCRDSGPTAELAAEHVELQHLSGHLRDALAAGEDATDVFSRFKDLLELHAAKEEVGLFPQVLVLGKLDDRISELIHEHDQLHVLLAGGAHGAGVAEALKLLAQHIDDEEYDLFPHVFNALDPEQWDEIELAHTAVEAAFASPV